MSQIDMPPSMSPRRRAPALAAFTALFLSPALASAQDSFARIDDPATGRPVLSVLGTGIGLPFASLALTMECPGTETWTVDVTGVRAPDGTGVAFGFGDPGGGWTPVRTASLRYEDRSVSVSLDRSAFRAALNQARAEHPGRAEAEARIVVGDAVGLVVNRDALVRAMTQFAQDCAAEVPQPPRRPVALRRVAYSR
jgi:hypothetical protein